MEELLFGCRYRATEKIGAGGMADVYKAVDGTLGRTVAVKVMHAHLASDASFAARFRHEAQAAANLVSPNIVNIYDWGQDSDTYYIVMEYVRGSDLKSIVLHKGALPSAQVAEIGAQICSALSAAHGYDVIHRDIKPHNIMVQPDGSVKVMDFGIARAGGTAMTQAGSVLGTAHYMSPEQAQGMPLTGASDVYSLGVVLYEAATGRPPFDAETPVAVALMQVNESAVPPLVANPDIDPDLAAIIVKAMRKDVAERYLSADELRRDLLAVAHGHRVDTTPGYAVAGGASADANSVSGATDCLHRVAETAVLPLVSGLNRGLSDRPSRTRVAARRKRVWPWALAATLLVAAGLGMAWNAGHLGSQSAVIPDVRSMTRAGAQAALEKVGFTLGSVKQDLSDSVKKGAVARQFPQPNTTAQKGSSVNLVLSKGPETISVPDVVGMVEADAFATIQKAGFSPQAFPSEFNQGAPANAVYRQTPASDRKAIKGSIVSYVVSRGAEPVAVPNAAGQGGQDGQDGNSGKSKSDRGRWW